MIHLPLEIEAAPGSTERRTWLGVAALLTLAAFAIRGSQFGNPLIQVDENFYLLVGDRMLHGALPFVDIWDRKPIGLFLLYAAIRLLGGVGIIQYQVVATLFAAATAFMVTRIARRATTMPAAVVAGLLYLLLLGLAGGTGGQAPVFYNLFVACAALVTLHAVQLDAPNRSEIRRLGLAAMALCGIAMQIKYTALFEGVFFGLVFMRLCWRSTGDPVELAKNALLWVVVAVAPTAAAFGYYAWLGHADAFVYANFRSIGARSSAPAAELLKRLAHSWNALCLPMVCVLLAVILKPWQRMAGGPRAFGFIMAWLGAALLGYLLFGTYFDHYALPLMAPIAAAAAPLFSYRPRRIGLIAACFMLLSGSIAYAAIVHANKKKRGGEAGAAAMVAAIQPRLKGCLFVYDGDPILYYLTHSCIATRYAFPTHLNMEREAGAIGIDPLAELQRILATRPRVIVDTLDDDESEENPAANAIVRAELQRDYRMVTHVPHLHGDTRIYERVNP